MMCARLFTKGAAEQILELCTLRIKDDSGVARFSQQEKQDLLDSFSGDGTRYSLVLKHRSCSPTRYLQTSTLL